jgi:hypothetical protein
MRERKQSVFPEFVYILYLACKGIYCINSQRNNKNLILPPLHLFGRCMWRRTYLFKKILSTS